MMVQTIYCWRCRMDVPMLEEADWRVIGPLMVGASSDPDSAQRALDAYFDLTGFRETNINAIWHHKTNEYGPPCRECGKPLRTDRARFCAVCGTLRDAPVALGEPTIHETDIGPKRSPFSRAWKRVSQFKPPIGFALVLCFVLYVVGQTLG